jgi:hypothetical protein
MAVTIASLGTAALIEWSSPWTILLFGAFFLMVIMGTWTGAVAAGRGRSMQWWFIIGFFLPIIGLIAVYVLKPLPAGEQAKG